MAMCDSDLNVLKVDARFPGSVHNSAVWQLSDANAFMQEHNNGNSFILADSGYAVGSYLLTPILNPSSEQERQYNFTHIRSRNCVERLFGVLKGRFRCCLKYRTLHYKPKVACDIINAVFTLHNICLKYRTPINSDLNDNELAEEIRIQYFQKLFQILSLILYT